MNSKVVTYIIQKISARFTWNKAPLGRWGLIPSSNMSVYRTTMDRKIDLANHDSCHCSYINHCIPKVDSSIVPPTTSK